MFLKTPAKIESIAWEGELMSPDVAMSAKPVPERPVVTIGKPEFWLAAEALETELGKKWTPPRGGATFWLARFACTLRDPNGRLQINAASQTLYLRPRTASAAKAAVYAYSLFPDRLTVEEKGTFNVKLNPELTFAKAISFKPGELGANIEYRQVFPVIQSYGAGEPLASWEFKAHPAHPIEGTQFVYAVIAVMPGADGGRGSIELTVTSQNQYGRIKYGLPQKAKTNVGFTI
ncbi:hypothetical protein MNBD_CHLOROFLEXI01-3304 [hydrothermal vent metagenome]|uniref:Uncharacterized protein n=1 Tax=hydrothermal vent metagenome TaxID=652676 RepID=A0A3B0VHB6_9ZZZZ